MLDLRGRSRVAPFLDPIARGMAKIKLSPTAVTILGLLVTIGGSAFIAAGEYVAGSLIAGFGGFLDALDGPLARLQGKASQRGAFVDTMSDRLGEVAIFAALSFALRHSAMGLMLCLFALAFSLLTPYVRAKAESWGAEGRGGWMGRAERMILALVGVGLEGLGLETLMATLWILVVLSGFTVAQRIRRTWQQLDA